MKKINREINEVIDVLGRFLGDQESKVYFLGNSQPASEVKAFLECGTIVPGDFPDAVSLLNNECLVMEHFQFDCYKSNRTGSGYQKNEALLERYFSHERQKGNYDLLRGEIKGKVSYKFWLNNLISSFKHHYSRIESYKRHLLEKNIISLETKVKVLFIIEDSSPLGTAVFDGEEIKRVIPALSGEFLKVFNDSPQVDFVITCSEFMEQKKVWLIPYSSLAQYEEAAINYSNMEFLESHPKVLAFVIED